MRTFASEGIRPPSGVSSKDAKMNNNGSSLLQQRFAGKNLVSSFLDSTASVIQQGIRQGGMSDGLEVPSATSGCSIGTEYRDDEGCYAEAWQVVTSQEARQEDERQDDEEGDWCSIAIEPNGEREGVAESRDCNIEQKPDRTPPTQAKNSLPLSEVVKKLSEKFGKHDSSSEEEASNASKASRASNSSFAKKALSAKVKKLSEKLDAVKRVSSIKSLKTVDSSGSVKKVDESKTKRGGSEKSIKDSKPDKANTNLQQTKPAGTPPLAPKPVAKKQSKKHKKAGKVTSPITKDTAVYAPASESTKSNNEHWTGRIVGLRLPANVDSSFDSKNKPIDRRIDASTFLASIQGLASIIYGSNEKTKLQAAMDGWSAWEKIDATANIALDICLSNESDPSSKPIKVHMIRDPNEDISQTLKRLQLTLQKKLGGKKKKKQKKGKQGGVAAGDQGKESDEAVLLRKIMPRCTGVSAPEITASKEAEWDVVTTNLWDGFYDAMLPINACNPWAGNPQDSTNEKELAGSKDSTADVYNLDYRNVENEESGSDESKMIKGYEQVKYKDSLTIDEVLNQAANMTDLGSYALSVPFVTASNSGSTSWVPLLLESCPPTIKSVSTFGSFNDSHLFERTPIVVEVGLLYATEARITWFADGELVCSDSSCYTPTKSDVDKVLTVVIVPQRSDHGGKGCEEAYQFKRRVEALPFLPNVIPMREEFMDRPSPNENQSGEDGMSLRVVTYNILADQNASRDLEKSDDANRMYSHCKNEHIIKWRRHPLILHELLEYSPDVISLQEVDTDVFDNYLKPVLHAKGYEGYYSQKGVDPSSGVREGCAIFWSLDVFESVRPVDMRTHTFREMIQQFSCEERMHKSQWKSLNDMSELLEKHNHLKHVLFNKLGHVMQTVVLTQRRSQEKVVIGNTHLFFHPMASHIRCLKMLMACRQMEIEHKENQHCPMIFCGDFNSHPNSGVMKLLLNRFLDSNNGKTWKHLCTYEWEKGAIGDELHHDVEAIDLEFPSSFPGLMSAYLDSPDFTHYIEAFVCTLDYILVTNNFEVEKNGATPSRQDIKKYVAMPNECMPSDHVSLVCDLKWR